MWTSTLKEGDKVYEEKYPSLILFDELDKDAQERIISVASASIQEQSNSRLPAAVPPKADPAY